ncbi:hypothetical protein AFM11_30110 [Mycolicibacterium wolinskyi]|uniref:Uncharacterized protein n=1 Tax=Mycolicibacterium wolinskyi TaxID=59750 RepID=A0A132PDM9_9MYCO|nr:hypothetical protein AFM11_30110 [Mycolicibacterium wolinskyi]
MERCEHLGEVLGESIGRVGVRALAVGASAVAAMVVEEDAKSGALHQTLCGAMPGGGAQA